MSHFVKYILIAALLLSGAACSVYKSNARKLLESQGPPAGSIKTSSVKMLVLTREQMNIASGVEVCLAQDCTQVFVCDESADNTDLVNASGSATQVDVTSLNSENPLPLALVCNQLN